MRRCTSVPRDQISWHRKDVVIGRLVAEGHASNRPQADSKGPRIQSESTRRESNAAALEGYFGSREGIFRSSKGPDGIASRDKTEAHAHIRQALGLRVSAPVGCVSRHPRHVFS
jgi:hypothetical protein